MWKLILIYNREKNNQIYSHFLWERERERRERGGGRKRGTEREREWRVSGIERKRESRRREERKREREERDSKILVQTFFWANKKKKKKKIASPGKVNALEMRGKVMMNSWDRFDELYLLTVLHVGNFTCILFCVMTLHFHKWSHVRVLCPLSQNIENIFLCKKRI